MKDSGLGAPCTSFPTSFCPRTGDVTGDGGTVVNPNPLQAIGTIPEQWRGSEDTAQKRVSTPPSLAIPLSHLLSLSHTHTHSLTLSRSIDPSLTHSLSLSLLPRPPLHQPPPLLSDVLEVVCAEEG